MPDLGNGDVINDNIGKVDEGVMVLVVLANVIKMCGICECDIDDRNGPM